MDEIDLVTWYAMKVLLWLGGSSLVAVLAILGGMLFYAGYVVGGLRRKERPRKPTKELQDYFRAKERPMGHAKLDHIKYDIQPDGSLGPGDNRNLEGPE